MRVITNYCPNLTYLLYCTNLPVPDTLSTATHDLAFAQLTHDTFSPHTTHSCQTQLPIASDCFAHITNSTAPLLQYYATLVSNYEPAVIVISWKSHRARKSMYLRTHPISSLRTDSLSLSMYLQILLQIPGTIGKVPSR
jgi:hypothetical protein